MDAHEGRSSSLQLLLAIYSPRRQLVELWMARPGVRLLVLTHVGAHGRLLQAEGPLLASQFASSCETLQRTTSSCFLLDGERGTLTDLAWSLLQAATTPRH